VEPACVWFPLYGGLNFLRLDDESGGKEAADNLWKSFEDCMLSPQSLNTKPNTKTPAPDAATTNWLTADACTPSEEDMMGMSDSYKDSNLKHDTHVGLHAVTSHQRKTCPRTNTAPCWQVPCDQVTREQPNVDPAVTPTSRGDQPHPLIQPVSKPCCHHPRKKVRFPSDSSISVVHTIVAWNYAYRAARMGPWEEQARDRAHFRRKIDNLALIIEPCLGKKIASNHIRNS
jgi:hypothetical protein